MKITILYFAAVRDLVDKDQEELDVPSSIATIEALGFHLTTIHPALGDRLKYVRFARNEEFAQAGDAIAHGDTIALIPPVAGG